MGREHYTDAVTRTAGKDRTLDRTICCTEPAWWDLLIVLHTAIQ